MLFAHAHVGDRHAPVNRLAHVINGQQGDAKLLIYIGLGACLRTVLSILVGQKLDSFLPSDKSTVVQKC